MMSTGEPYDPFKDYKIPGIPYFPYKPISPPQTGWVCPKCGKVHAPWMPSCNCTTDEYKVTCAEPVDKIDY